MGRMNSSMETGALLKGLKQQHFVTEQMQQFQREQQQCMQEGTLDNLEKWLSSQKKCGEVDHTEKLKREQLKAQLFADEQADHLQWQLESRHI